MLINILPHFKEQVCWSNANSFPRANLIVKWLPQILSSLKCGVEDRYGLINQHFSGHQLYLAEIDKIDDGADHENET